VLVLELVSFTPTLTYGVMKVRGVISMGLRTELHIDGDRCQDCRSLLSERGSVLKPFDGYGTA
jgi:hypothetical protein